MKSTDDLDLLRKFTCEQSQDAFAELVQRHLNLVYSAGLRQVRSPQLAEEVTQSVFTDLARQADQLKPDTILTAWLYDVTRRTAINVVRGEARRQIREQIAVEMNAMNATSEDWTQIEPLLDEAMHALDEADRTAVLLRYFENKSLREVGETLGTTDDTARKRVNRAVERLREFFAHRGVTVGASGLVVVLSTNAVQAAPMGLGATVSIAATFAGTGIVTTITTAATATKAIVMTTLQKIAVSVACISLIGVALYEARQVASLREQNQALRQEHGSLVSQLEQLQRDRDTAKQPNVIPTDNLVGTNKNPTEVLKLRGQVGVLRKEKAELGSKSALSKITADPETRKAMREQQKAGMSAIYSDFAKRLKLAPEPAGQLKDVLADSVMDNIDVITQALHDKKSATEIDQLFAAQESGLHAKVEALLGSDGLASYKEYSGHILTDLVASGFEKNFSGDARAKADKKAQMTSAMQEEMQSALAAANLPPDFQTLPILNFRNIASEEWGEQSLRLMDNIFERVGTRGSAFLTSDEQQQWQDFRKEAVANNRSALLMNRKLMAPIAQ